MGVCVSDIVPHIGAARDARDVTYLVCVDIAAGRASIAVRDGPGVARLQHSGAAQAGVVDGLSLDLRGRELAAEHPQVRGPGVEVKVQRLTRSADRYRRDIRIIVATICQLEGSKNQSRRTT